MTYIDLVNKAWELREQGIITPQEHDLFNYLIHKCNRLNWKNPFNQSTKIICAVLGINRNMLTHRRKRLKHLGLITFREGKTRVRPAEYTICGISTILVNNNDKENDNKNQKRKNKKFEKPQLEEIELYCKERKNGIDPQTFFDFYESKGWMIGNNTMKDWQAAVRSWEAKLKKEKHQFTNHSKDKRYEMF